MKFPLLGTPALCQMVKAETNDEMFQICLMLGCTRPLHRGQDMNAVVFSHVLPDFPMSSRFKAPLPSRRSRKALFN
jgi:hypothetical protein